MVYIGRRWTSGAKAPGYGWIEVGYEAFSSSAASVFANIKGNAVGGIYVVKVARDEIGHINTAWQNPKYTGDNCDNLDLVAAWQAIDKTTRADDRLRKAEARAAKSPDLALALQPLRRVLSHARTFDEADAILRAVTRELMNDYTKGKLS